MTIHHCRRVWRRRRSGEILLDLVSITIKNGISFRKKGWRAISVHTALCLARHASQPGPARWPVTDDRHGSATAMLSNPLSQVLARPSEWLELFKAPRQRGAFFFALPAAQILRTGSCGIHTRFWRRLSIWGRRVGDCIETDSFHSVDTRAVRACVVCVVSTSARACSGSTGRQTSSTRITQPLAQSGCTPGCFRYRPAYRDRPFSPATPTAPATGRHNAHTIPAGAAYAGLLSIRAAVRLVSAALSSRGSAGSACRTACSTSADPLRIQRQWLTLPLQSFHSLKPVARPAATLRL